ncbi:uncharacterized protein si:dkeyp-110g5.4 isoform X2 [Betta splendens]|nr:uncharacterized protein si:dkeyp-110g5.4 isoform X2 [Betta splendens]
MDLYDRIEIFIPAEAEVKRIPLWSLPNPVLRRMGLPVSDSNGSKKLTNSPKGTWICPAVVRKKGQKSGCDAMESTLTLLRTECRASSGPFRMSFVFFNHTAFKVLKDTVPGSKLSTIPPHMSSIPQGLASKTYQTAVVVYAGRIYLSVRRPGRGQDQAETAQPSPQPTLPVRRQCKSQKKELPPGKKKPKNTPCKVTHKKGLKHRNVSSSTDAHSVTQSTVGMHSAVGHCHEDARAKKNPLEAGAQESTRHQPQVEATNSGGSECVMRDVSSGEAESVSQNHDVDSNVQSGSGDVDQSCSQSWTRRDAVATFPSPSLKNKFDFKELAEEEMIGRMKARLKQNAQQLPSAQSD